MDKTDDGADLSDTQIQDEFEKLYKQFKDTTAFVLTPKTKKKVKQISSVKRCKAVLSHEDHLAPIPTTCKIIISPARQTKDITSIRNISPDSKDVTKSSAPARRIKYVTKTSSPARWIKDVAKTSSSARQTKDVTKTSLPARQTKDVTKTSLSARQTKDVTKTSSPARQTKDVTKTSSPARQTKDVTKTSTRKLSPARQQPSSTILPVDDLSGYDSERSDCSGVAYRSFRKDRKKVTKSRKTTKKHITNAKDTPTASVDITILPSEDFNEKVLYWDTSIVHTDQSSLLPSTNVGNSESSKHTHSDHMSRSRLSLSHLRGLFNLRTEENVPMPVTNTSLLIGELSLKIDQKSPRKLTFPCLTQPRLPELEAELEQEEISPDYSSDSGIVSDHVKSDSDANKSGEPLTKNNSDSSLVVVDEDTEAGYESDCSAKSGVAVRIQSRTDEIINSVCKKIKGTVQTKKQDDHSRTSNSKFRNKNIVETVVLPLKRKSSASDSTGNNSKKIKSPSHVKDDTLETDPFYHTGSLVSLGLLETINDGSVIDPVFEGRQTRVSQGLGNLLHSVSHVGGIWQSIVSESCP